MAAMQPMRHPHMFAPMVNAAGVAHPSPPMRGTSPNITSVGATMNGSNAPGLMPYMQASHTHIPGQYQAYNAHSAGVGGNASASAISNTNANFGEDDGQGGFGNRGARGGRGGRGGRARGRTGRGRTNGGRFNNQSYQGNSQNSIVGASGQPENGRQTPQSATGPSSEGESTGKILLSEPETSCTDVGLVHDVKLSSAATKESE
jgi:hypothetical protein